MSLATLQGRLSRLEIRSSGATAATVPRDPITLAARAGLVLDPWQQEMLLSPARQILLNCSRQAGKSTVVAVGAAHDVLAEPGSLVLCLSVAQRQSVELVRKIRDILAAIGVRAFQESALRLELRNGSRIIALPGRDDAAIRGFSQVSRLLIDEAARVSDALYHATRPMLSVSQGSLVALSTPWGKRGWFHEEFTEHSAEWDCFEVTAYDCPRISPEFLEQERRQLPDRIFRQEYLCEFTDTEDSVFSYDLVQRALQCEAVPLFAGA